MARSMMKLFSVSALGESGMAGICRMGLCTSHVSRTCSSSKSLEKLVKNLDKEIEKEQKGVKKLPAALMGFNVGTTGDQLILSKMHMDEKVKIVMDASDSTSYEEGEEEDEIMSSDPISFQVMVTKADGHTLELQCTAQQYNDDEFDEDDDAVGDKGRYFEVDNISILKQPEGNMSSSADSYSLSDEMIDVIYDYLEERGVSDDLVNEMTVLQAVSEQHIHVEFLKDFKSFIASSSN